MRPLFIGDEYTAAAYRLAGLDVSVTAPAQAGAALAAARRGGAPFIMITAACAAGVPGAELDAALAAFAPPVCVVPDASVPLPDLTQRVRATLGIAA